MRKIKAKKREKGEMGETLNLENLDALEGLREHLAGLLQLPRGHLGESFNTTNLKGGNA